LWGTGQQQEEEQEGRNYSKYGGVTVLEHEKYFNRNQFWESFCQRLQTMPPN
jgi:hypothetical protein